MHLGQGVQTLGYHLHNVAKWTNPNANPGHISWKSWHIAHHQLCSCHIPGSWRVSQPHGISASLLLGSLALPPQLCGSPRQVSERKIVTLWVSCKIHFNAWGMLNVCVGTSSIQRMLVFRDSSLNVLTASNVQIEIGQILPSRGIMYWAGKLQFWRFVERRCRLVPKRQPCFKTIKQATFTSFTSWWK